MSAEQTIADKRMLRPQLRHMFVAKKVAEAYVVEVAC